MMSERLCQRLCLRPGLGHAEPDMRPRRRSCVANEGHATERQAGQTEVVNWRKERLVDMMEAVEVLWRQHGFHLSTHLRNQVFADERRWYRELVLLTMFVYAHILQFLGRCHAVPAEIVTPVAGPQLII